VKNITDEWQTFKSMCYGKNGLTPNQETQLHKAFFAGSLSTLTNLMEATDLSDEAAEVRLSEMFQEVTQVCIAATTTIREQN